MVVGGISLCMPPKGKDICTPEYSPGSPGNNIRPYPVDRGESKRVSHQQSLDGQIMMQLVLWAVKYNL